MSAKDSQPGNSALPPSDMESAATRVVRLLQDAGHTAYFAGGCVRDLVMGRAPNDYDVATSATPEQVSKLFHRTQQVGAKFGVVLVRMQRISIEVATFRTDHDYADGRRPTGVTFSSPEEDANRRDFTINGMFYDPVAREVIDFVGGRKDIAAKVIRAIGEPARRFAEDHLRLLRAIRFAARLGFSIEPETWNAMCRHAADLRRISPERIRMELEGVFSNENRAAAMEQVVSSGLLAHLWPGAELLIPLAPAAIQRMRHWTGAATFENAMALVIADLPVAEVTRSLEALRCSNETIAVVRWLHAHQRDFDEPSKVTLADLKLRMAHAAFGDLLALIEARRKTENQSTSPIDEIRSRAGAIAPGKVAPMPFINGDDLKAMGLEPGPKFKTILEQIYYAQLNDELTSREQALDRARSLTA